MVFKPGTTATVFNARNTRNVRSTATFANLTKIVIYLMNEKSYFSLRIDLFTYARVMTIKSNQFHGSRKNVNFFRINPRATHLVNASNV